MQRITVVMFGVDNIVLPPALASAPTLPPTKNSWIRPWFFVIGLSVARRTFAAGENAIKTYRPAGALSALTYLSDENRCVVDLFNDWSCT